MKQVFELKNISEETQLVLNENLEKVEVETGETFRTTERSYLKNYAHIFALATDDEETKKDKKSESKSKKAKDQTPQDPEPTVEPQNNDGGSVEEKKAETDPVDPETEATDNTQETQGAENAPETSKTEGEEEKKAESETQETA